LPQRYQTLFAELGEDLADLLKREDVVRSFLEKKRSSLAQEG
jgi:hypothetical protein